MNLQNNLYVLNSVLKEVIGKYEEFNGLFYNCDFNLLTKSIDN